MTNQEVFPDSDPAEVRRKVDAARDRASAEFRADQKVKRKGYASLPTVTDLTPDPDGPTEAWDAPTVLDDCQYGVAREGDTFGVDGYAVCMGGEGPVREGIPSRREAERFILDSLADGAIGMATLHLERAGWDIDLAISNLGDGSDLADPEADVNEWTIAVSLLREMKRRSNR